MTLQQDDLLGMKTNIDAAQGALALPSSQWRIENLQVVNWGGFEGHHTVPYHPDATLISGGSGTGKSTLLDAYTALMQPAKVAFNGASNDAGSGRARSETGGQRTLLTYLRGKQGVNDESGGANSDHVLRGVGRPTWGAVAATFVDDGGRTVTAMRIYHVPAAASDAASISQRMCLIRDRINLADLGPQMAKYTAGQQLANVLTGLWPGLEVTQTYSAFANKLFRHLAIGTNGDGEKALELLARIQAGGSVNSVNALYRDLVLDTPRTFDAAEKAIEHFDHIAADLAQMEEDAKKHQLLEPIRDIEAKLSAAQQTLSELDEFGVDEPPGTPTRLANWAAQKEEAVLEGAIRDATQVHEEAATAFSEASQRVQQAKQDWKDAEADYRASGGDELANLSDQLERLAGDLTVAEGRRAELEPHLRSIGTSVRDRADFDGVKAAASRFVVSHRKWVGAHSGRLQDLGSRRHEPLAKQANVRRDLDRMRRSESRIRYDLDSLRQQVAACVGMDPVDLPFLAELIDIRPGEERWRTAVETVLGGEATRVIVPRPRLRDFSRAVDDLQFSGVLRFIAGDENVGQTHPLRGTTDPDQAQHVLGKLVFKEHPYAGWIQRRLAEPNRNAICVQSPDDLNRGGFRVTIAGQTRSGDTGSIGRANRHNVIGFSNDDEISVALVELTELQCQLDGLEKESQALEEEQQKYSLEQAAYAAIGSFRWEDVDVATLAGDLESKQKRHNQLLGSDDKLRALKSYTDELEETHVEELSAQTKVKEARDNAHKRWSGLIDKKDKATTIVDRLQFNTDLELTPLQMARLDALYCEAESIVPLGRDTEDERFPHRLAAMKKSLSSEHSQASREIAETESSLGRIFATYKSNWDEPNLSASLSAYPDFLAKLETLEAAGLYNNADGWRHTVVTFATNDLLPLNGRMTGEIAKIKERVEPINAILSALPFGARRGRLRLKVDDVISESVKQFRARLKKLSEAATKDMDFAQTVRMFREIEDFLIQLRDGKDPKSSEKSDRARFLDVRRHVEVYAAEYPVASETWQAQEHRQLGSASGGESQELIAFIIGSALRFRLGDELRALPRFAPVFLDEGFVKADSEFAGRAVSAWKGLGFQIIIGAPEDKFTGLERHMNAFVTITKDPIRGYSYIDHISDAEGHGS